MNASRPWARRLGGCWSPRPGRGGVPPQRPVVHRRALGAVRWDRQCPRARSPPSGWWGRCGRGCGTSGTPRPSGPCSSARGVRQRRGSVGALAGGRPRSAEWGRPGGMMLGSMGARPFSGHSSSRRFAAVRVRRRCGRGDDRVRGVRRGRRPPPRRRPAACCSSRPGRRGLPPSRRSARRPRYTGLGAGGAVGATCSCSLAGWRRGALWGRSPARSGAARPHRVCRVDGGGGAAAAFGIGCRRLPPAVDRPPLARGGGGAGRRVRTRPGVGDGRIPRAGGQGRRLPCGGRAAARGACARAIRWDLFRTSKTRTLVGVPARVVGGPPSSARAGDGRGRRSWRPPACTPVTARRR